MVTVENLRRDQLVDIVRAVQESLFVDFTDEPCFDPDKEWACADICSVLAEKLKEHDLAPTVRDKPGENPG